MKKHSLTKVLAVILLLVIIASHFLEGRQGISYIAIGDVALNYFQSFYYFFDTALFVLVVGAFYGVLEHIPAYNKLQETIAGKAKNNKKAIFTIIVIFTLLSALTGLNVMLLIFIPFAISLILTMGYDKLVALLSTVGAVTMGLISGIFITFRDPLDYYGTSFTTFEKFVGLKNNYVNIIPKIGLLIVTTLILIFFVNKYIKKTKKVKVEEKEENIKKEQISKVEKIKESPKEIKTEPKKEIQKEEKQSPKQGAAKKNNKDTKISKTTKKTNNKKNLSAAKQEDTIVIKADKKIRIWPLIAIFIIMLIILVLGYMPWNSLFELTIFDDYHTWLTSHTFGELNKYILVIICLILLITIINFKNKVIKEKKVGRIILNIVLMLIELILIETLVVYTFNIKLFGLNKLVKSLELWDSSIFNTLVSNNFTAFGTWGTIGNYMMAIMTLLLFIAILKVVYKIKFDDLLDYCKEGMKKMLPSMLMVMLAYTVLICIYNNGFMEPLIADITEKFADNIMVHSLLTILGSITNVDIYYTAAGIFANIVNGLSEKANLEIFAIAFQSFYGLVQLIGPTSILLITSLTYTEFSYKEWFKNTWRIVLTLFIVIFGIMLIVSLI